MAGKEPTCNGVITRGQNEPEILTQNDSSAKDKNKIIKKFVIDYLQSQKCGTTISRILQHLRRSFDTEDTDFYGIVENVLESGLILGFLERKNCRSLINEYCETCKRQSCCCQTLRRKIQRRCSNRRRHRKRY